MFPSLLVLLKDRQFIFLAVPGRRLCSVCGTSSQSQCERVTWAALTWSARRFHPAEGWRACQSSPTEKLQQTLRTPPHTVNTHRPDWGPISCTWHCTLQKDACKCLTTIISSLYIASVISESSSFTIRALTKGHTDRTAELSKTASPVRHKYHTSAVSWWMRSSASLCSPHQNCMHLWYDVTSHRPFY